jgi:hypothetical protein
MTLLGVSLVARARATADGAMTAPQRRPELGVVQHLLEAGWCRRLGLHGRSSWPARACGPLLIPSLPHGAQLIHLAHRRVT